VPSAADFLLALVIEDEDGPVACGALRVLDDATVDLKRMYVIPERRGQGLARSLLARLEDAARARGFTVARLGTGRLQPEAINLYVSAGYREIPPYGEYAEVAESRCFQRAL
jgi:putative acetyltransferase